MIKTQEDKIETKKIYDDVLVEIFGDVLKEYKTSDILYHTSVEGIILKRGEFRNITHETIKIPYDKFLISFHSDINPNGIGDGQLPNIARTYSINISIFNSQIRLYRYKSFNLSNLGINPYIYSRTLEGLKNKLENKLDEYVELMDQIK